MGANYTGRFAPSPTGPLHDGSLVAALASWLDARAHDGVWLVRIEDLDEPRCVAGADRFILGQLATCGLQPDQPPAYQSRRGQLYQDAFEDLIEKRLAYPCSCTRLEIRQALEASGAHPPRFGDLVYPGTCRHGLDGRPARAWRLLTNNFEQNQLQAHELPALVATKSVARKTSGVSTVVDWCDRRLGPQQQDVGREVGDFVLRRADGLWAYQLAVVVDDARQGITHVVRGEDLADNTARQIMLQRALGLEQPQYLHTPLVLGGNGEKLSKQNGASAVDLGDPLAALGRAGFSLGLDPMPASSVSDWLALAVTAWRPLYKR